MEPNKRIKTKPSTAPVDPLSRSEQQQPRDVPVKATTQYEKIMWCDSDTPKKFSTVTLSLRSRESWTKTKRLEASDGYEISLEHTINEKD